MYLFLHKTFGPPVVPENLVSAQIVSRCVEASENSRTGCIKITIDFPDRCASNKSTELLYQVRKATDNLRTCSPASRETAPRDNCPTIKLDRQHVENVHVPVPEGDPERCCTCT